MIEDRLPLARPRCRRLTGVRIVGTGSYANLIAAKLPELQIIDLDLTLEGLRVIALRNFPS